MIRNEKPAVPSITIAAAVFLFANIGRFLAQRQGVTFPLEASNSHGLLGVYCRWDCGWYLSIAENGYSYRPGIESPVAYFPLYPMLIRAVSWVLQNTFLSAVFITLTASVAALFLLHRWSLLWTNPGFRRGPAPTSTPPLIHENAASNAAWYFALFPYAFYLYGTVYSDAVFVVCAVGAFYALEKDRVWLAVLAGALATACRPIAPAVVIGLTFRAIERRRGQQLPIRFRDLAVVFSGAGLALWMAYLQYRFDDALAFVHVQSAPGWAQPPGLRTWLKLDLWQMIFVEHRIGPLLRHGPQAIIGIALCALAWPTYRRLGLGYAVYVFLVAFIPLVSTKDFQGLGRYALAGFPAFFTAADLIETWGFNHRRVLTLSALGLLLASAGFGAGLYLS